MSLKNYSFKSPEKKWDYVVVGSGMGGMTAASLLSKLGKKVLILEQHYVPGGFTHTFSRDHWQWDVGVHAIGEVTKHSMVGRVLHSLTGQRLKWKSLGQTYDEFHFPDNFHVEFPDSPKKFAKELKVKFPKEHKAVDRYIKDTRDATKAMRSYFVGRTLPKVCGQIWDQIAAKKAYSYLSQTTKEYLDELTEDEKLKTVLASQWGYYGSVPSRSSFGIQALVTRHFIHGAYYPQGGSQEIASQMLKTVADGGGWTRVRCSVDEVLIENGATKGVKLKNGQLIKTKNVISAVGAIETVSRLLPKDEQKKAWVKKLTSLHPSNAHICLYLGFKGDIEKAGATKANQWYWSTWNAEKDIWHVEDKQAVAPILYTSFPSLKKGPKSPMAKGYHTGEVVTFVDPKLFEKFAGARTGRRGKEYDDLKKEITDRILKDLFRRLPKLEPLLEHAELSTPLTTDHYTRSNQGSIYGIEPTPQRFLTEELRPQTPVKGLYMTGSDMASAGVIGAMVGGVLTGLSCEPIKAVPYLRRFV